MIVRPLSLAAIGRAVAAGRRLAAATRAISAAYALLFVAGGLLIFSALWRQGWLPFLPAAAGAFMLLGPVTLAGFFGIACASEAGQPPGAAAIAAGFRRAAGALWALAVVCGLLFMIFITDAAILYAYLVGGDPIAVGDWLPHPGVGRFLLGAGVSGLFVALMLYAISAFSVALLCERRTGLVAAVVLSVRIVFANLPQALLWALLLAGVGIASALLLPLLPLTLPWLAYASRALYREVLPPASEGESG